MARKILILGVFGWLVMVTASSGVEIRQFLQGQIHNLSVVAKGRL